jgi:hypothetical protein
VQKEAVSLGRWLQSSAEPVPARWMQQMTSRLETHEKQQHDEATALLSTGKFPAVLYSAVNHNPVQPAILCIMHACEIAKRNKLVYLPVPQRDVVCHVSSSPPLARDNPAGTDSNWQEKVGEVWWLFDAEQPYLAEVFKNGQVPDSRLPHLDRSIVKGRDVAHILGRSRQHIKTLRPNATRILYTPWCVPNVSTHLYLLRGNKCGSSVAHERTCMQDLKPVPAEGAARLQEAV